MKIWVDDVRSAPEGYVWCRSVNEARSFIAAWELLTNELIELIDLDYDSGDYEKYGGPYIKLMDWLVERNFVSSCFSFSKLCWNGIYEEDVQAILVRRKSLISMRRIIRKNGWKEID